MIITRAPYRISFFGGGSDLESFYSQSPGAVISTSINKYTYISTHRFFDVDKIRVKYSKTETKGSVAEIEHPIVREVLKKFRIEGAMEISSNGDVVAGSGLELVGVHGRVLHNMYTHEGRFAGKQQLAEEACDVEINRLGEPIGKQDQYAAAFGGLNVIRFPTVGQTVVETVHLKKEIYQGLERNLLMFYTGVPRSTSSILGEQTTNMSQRDSSTAIRRCSCRILTVGLARVT